MQMMGAADWLRWAMNICARDGYVSPSISRMMGGARSTDTGMTLLELHGQAACIIAIVDRLPEPYQAAIWFRAGVLPHQMMRSLAAYLAPHVVRMMPTGVSNLRAVAMAIMNTAGINGSSKQAISRELQVRTADGAQWAADVAQRLDSFGRAAEAEVDRIMRGKGLICA
ncbi:hypothetical protein [Thauera humireducens]|uniref:hypothetical protein n=1 Tax=Thauera humireducens TaxID=1134435 RepID=UPI00311F5491